MNQTRFFTLLVSLLFAVMTQAQNYQRVWLLTKQAIPLLVLLS